MRRRTPAKANRRWWSPQGRVATWRHRRSRNFGPAIGSAPSAGSGTWGSFSTVPYVVGGAASKCLTPNAASSPIRAAAHIPTGPEEIGLGVPKGRRHRPTGARSAEAHRRNSRGSGGWAKAMAGRGHGAQGGPPQRAWRRTVDARCTRGTRKRADRSARRGDSDPGRRPRGREATVPGCRTEQRHRIALHG